MQAHQEEEHFVDFSGRIILECKRCGETMILFGLEEDWSSESSEFECPCGGSVTLADRQSEEVLSVKKMLRASLGYNNWPQIAPRCPSPAILAPLATCQFRSRIWVRDANVC